MADLAIWSDGFHIDDAGNAISVHYVDLRASAARVPIATLVKSSRREHGLDVSGTILIASPAYHREHHEGPMHDPAEGKASRVSQERNTGEDLVDLAEARIDDDELNRASGLVGGTLRVTSTTTGVRRSSRTTKSTIHGKNCWIFCTSIEPLGQSEIQAWQESMDPAYCYEAYIHRPREFARALGSMVVEQLGPCGQEMTITHKYNGIEQPLTRHANQLVFHGPVKYVDDTYEALAAASSDLERTLLSVFAKHREFAAEREYRFVVWTEEEPPPEPKILAVSRAMLGSLVPRSIEPQHFPPITLQEEPSERVVSRPTETDSTGMEAALISDLLDLADNPSTRVAPYAYSSDDPPEGLHRALTTYSATQALRHAVDRLTGERKVQAAGAAWHAEPCVRQLCATFEDPVETVRVTDDNFIVVTIRFPSGHLSEAELAFSPRGMSSCSVRRDRGETLSRSHNAWVGGLAMDGILEKLEAAGACLRTGSPEPH